MGKTTVAFVCALASFTGVFGDTTCNLYLTATLANPAGTVQCSASGTLGTWEGSNCVKLNANGVISQTCSGLSGTDLCTAWNNPTSCCTVPHLGTKMVCAGNGGFPNAPTAADFNECSTECALPAGIASGANGISAASIVLGLAMAVGAEALVLQRN